MSSSAEHTHPYVQTSLSSSGPIKSNEALMAAPSTVSIVRGVADAVHIRLKNEDLLFLLYPAPCDQTLTERLAGSGLQSQITSTPPVTPSTAVFVGQVPSQLQPALLAWAINRLLNESDAVRVATVSAHRRCGCVELPPETAARALELSETAMFDSTGIWIARSERQISALRDYTRRLAAGEFGDELLAHRLPKCPIVLRPSTANGQGLHSQTATVGAGNKKQQEEERSARTVPSPAAAPPLDSASPSLSHAASPPSRTPPASSGILPPVLFHGRKRFQLSASMQPSTSDFLRETSFSPSGAGSPSASTGIYLTQSSHHTMTTPSQAPNGHHSQYSSSPGNALPFQTHPSYTPSHLLGLPAESPDSATPYHRPQHPNLPYPGSVPPVMAPHPFHYSQYAAVMPTNPVAGNYPPAMYAPQFSPSFAVPPGAMPQPLVYFAYPPGAGQMSFVSDPPMMSMNSGMPLAPNTQQPMFLPGQAQGPPGGFSSPHYQQQQQHHPRSW